LNVIAHGEEPALTMAYRLPAASIPDGVVARLSAIDFVGPLVSICVQARVGVAGAEVTVCVWKGDAEPV
jgi:hypothetical protein